MLPCYKIQISSFQPKKTKKNKNKTQKPKIKQKERGYEKVYDKNNKAVFKYKGVPQADPKVAPGENREKRLVWLLLKLGDGFE